MKVTPDTNLLLRLFVDDDPDQGRLAATCLEQAELIAISLQVLCELVWVLGRHYGTARKDIALSIRQLLETQNVVANRAAAEAGLAVLEAGGDFADGVIAFEGDRLGGSTFITFDKKAAKLLSAQGHDTKLLAT